MNNRGALLNGVGLGAGLTYFLDPGRGARRRARVRDSLAHTFTLTRRAIGTTSRDALHRTYGTAATVRRALSHDRADDIVLVERVRARLGRIVSHPHAVEVAASDGVVRLRGQILKHELEPLLHEIRRTRGVKEVIDELEGHKQAGDVPALQGGSPRIRRRVDILQDQWSPTTRTLVGAAGLGLIGIGASRRDVPGTLFALGGGALIARALTNTTFNRITGVRARRRAVDVQKTIMINAAAEEVFAFWSLYENFPRFMSRVLDVTTSAEGTRSHWKVAGPGGIPVTFDVEITRVVPNALIAWRTIPGSTVAHAGIVRFDREGERRTRVHLRMSYNPPAGWLGHSVATALGADPKSGFDADLVRMKTLIETGHAARDAARRR